MELYAAITKNGNQSHLMKGINLNFKTGKLLIILKTIKRAIGTTKKNRKPNIQEATGRYFVPHSWLPATAVNLKLYHEPRKIH